MCTLFVNNPVRQIVITIAYKFSGAQQVQKTLWIALHDAGYLDREAEQSLGEYWFEWVYDNIIGRGAQSFESDARER